MSLHGITFNSTMPLAALVFSALAAATDLPFVMVTCALLYSLAAITVLRFADGGITKVVADSRAEYRIIAFEPSPAGPGSA